MLEKIPSAARFFYFHVDNTEEIKKLWKAFAKEIGVDVNAKDPGEIIKEGFQKHGTTKVAAVKGRKADLHMLLYRNIVIISGLFYISGALEKVKDKVAYADLPGIEVSIGGATVLISKNKGAEDEVQKIGREYTKIETNIGDLYQFKEEEGHKEHLYALIATGLEEVGHFLSLHLPIFDFSIHKLHMERDYFRNQRKWVMSEKAEIDKTIGDILHKRIVGKTLNPEFIDALEKEIDTLSTKYALLVNDGHLVRKARTALENNILEVHKNLGNFGSLPDEGLGIIKETEELKGMLQEDETSISYAIKNTKTAIDTVRTNIDLLRSRENIHLQEEAISFQVAAGVLEFIIIFYYSIASWEHLIGVERLDLISPPTRFISIFLFASFAVALTHFVGESFREHWKINNGMIITGAALFIVFIFIVYLSIQTGHLLGAEVAH